MKITFYRQGHSNNSSSSHSLIFTKNCLNDDTVGTEFSDSKIYFGWYNFICASKKLKASYLRAILKSTFKYMLGARIELRPFYTMENEWYKKNKRFYSALEYAHKEMDALIDKTFESFLKHVIGIPEIVNAEDAEIDHKSLIFLPFDRVNTELIHAGFAISFCKEFLNKNYAILGKNDNFDDNFSYLAETEEINESELSEQIKNYKIVWRLLMDCYPYASENGKSEDIPLCAYDAKTKEYVISPSKKNGHIIKIKFDE